MRRSRTWLGPHPTGAGGALDSAELTLTAGDGTRFSAFRASAAAPSGAGIIVLPDVRGLHAYYEDLALRFAEHGVDAVAIDYFGRTAGLGRRDQAFEYMPHVARTTWAGLSADSRAAATYLRSPDGGAVSFLFTIGLCFGGRVSFLAATLGLGLAGVIGFYGWPGGASRNDTPAPTDVAGVDHRVITYPGAPHSFFDRRAEEYAHASEQAWAETIGFVRGHNATG